MPLGTEVGLGPDDIVLDGDPAPPPKGAHQPPLFGLCLLWPNGRPSQQLLSSCGHCLDRTFAINQKLTTLVMVDVPLRNFSKSTVWDKVAQGSTDSFEDS